MSTTTPVPTPVVAATTPFATYAAVLLPAIALILTGLQAVEKAPGDWTVIVSFALLVLGAVGSYGVRLLPTGWQGRTKVLITVAAGLLASLVPFITPGGFDPNVDSLIIVNAVLQALGVQLGVDIRTAPIDAREVRPGEVPSITTVSAVDSGVATKTTVSVS